MPYLSGYEACPPPPFLAAPPPPPPPTLKVVREWEGVSVWPDATPPPVHGGQHFSNLAHFHKRCRKTVSAQSVQYLYISLLHLQMSSRERFCFVSFFVGYLERHTLQPVGMHRDCTVAQGNPQCVANCHKFLAWFLVNVWSMCVWVIHLLVHSICVMRGITQG